MEKVQKFYRFKQKHPKYTKDLLPNTVRPVFEAQIVQLNPRRTQNGCRMVLVNCASECAFWLSIKATGWKIHSISTLIDIYMSP